MGAPFWNTLHTTAASLPVLPARQDAAPSNPWMARLLVRRLSRDPGRGATPWAMICRLKLGLCRLCTLLGRPPGGRVQMGEGQGQAAPAISRRDPAAARVSTAWNAT